MMARGTRQNVERGVGRLRGACGSCRSGGADLGARARRLDRNRLDQSRGRDGIHDRGDPRSRRFPRNARQGFLSLLLGLIVFEAATLATSLLWFAYPRLAWLVWTEFSIQALFSLALLIFVFAFRITRLI